MHGRVLPCRSGAYSTFFPGWRDKFFETLTKPLKAKSCHDPEETNTRIIFAGEAMCDDLSGYTHGACKQDTISSIQNTLSRVHTLASLTLSYYYYYY